MSSLAPLFSPASVALVGATESHGVGRAIFENLTEACPTRPLYPINPNRAEVLGRPCYPSLASTPTLPDLAVIVTPARTVAQVVRECGEIGTKAAIVISAGFREAGEIGKEREREVIEAARTGGVRFLGPNCLGLMNPHSGLNATFAKGRARPGRLALVSQSGALCTAILDWAERERVGFSAFVSGGSMADIGWGDMLSYLGDDPHTRAIALYMESVEDARDFMSAAREVALSKPIVAIKPGRTKAAAKAAASHTGAMTGQDEVLDAAFRRCGVLRVDTIAELFYLAEALDQQPRPKGTRLGIVTNAGGPAVLATDAVIAAGGEIATYSPETLEKLDKFLPPHWSHGNPLDVLGDATATRYADAAELALADPGTDGVLAIVAPQAVTDPADVARELIPRVKRFHKPILASWMGGDGVVDGIRVLHEAGIPTYAYPDSAAKVFAAMARFDSDLKQLYETPRPEEGLTAALNKEALAHVESVLLGAKTSGRTILTEVESKQILGAYGLPVVPTLVAESADAAVVVAKKLGFPVVVKLHSRSVTHKSDVGGVRLGVFDADAVRAAFAGIEADVAKAVGPGHFQGVTVQPMVRRQGYELVLGAIADPQFGPVVSFGAGGQLVEVYRDTAVALPPLNSTLARRTMERTTIYRALRGVRGQKPVDLAALERLLVRFSEFVAEQTSIREVEINPLLASPEGFFALDARILLHAPGEGPLPRPAIRPYPNQYVGTWQFPDATPVTIRPIRPDDESAMIRFHQALSNRSVYMRYFHMIDLEERVAHERLVRTCFSDYDRDMALVAEVATDGGHEIVAVGRLSRARRSSRAELALLVRDAYQGRGLGTELSRRLLEIAPKEGITEVRAAMLDENVLMRGICTDLGFDLRRDDTGVHAVLRTVV